MYDAIIFDLDGTLADSVDLHVEAWKRAMKELGMDVSPQEEKKYRENVGKSLRDILVAIYGPSILEIYPEVKKRKARYLSRMLNRLKPLIPPDVLRELKKRHRLAVFTSTTRDQATRMLEALGILPLFDVIVTADDVSRGKPHPEGLLRAVKVLGAKNALYVGDTRYDEEMARRAGVDYMDVRRFLRTWKSLL